MKKQKGGILVYVLSGILAVIFIGAISVVIYAVGVKNNCKDYENNIDAIYLDMQNVHANMFQKMQQLGVPVDKYGDMVVKALEATFGKGGSKAAFQFLKEQGTIPPQIMDKLNVAIEASYNKFEATQRTKIDVANGYKNYAEDWPRSIFVEFFGYPKRPWSELLKIVTSAQTKADFESGELSDPGIFKKD